MSTETVWEAGCWVDGWWGHYSTAVALLTALELGWEPEQADSVRLLARWDLSRSGGSAALGGWSEWELDAHATALADSEGWSLEEDLGQILGEDLDRAENWLNCQPQTPEGHYWGHSEYGGWGLWQWEEEL